jgi:hypothetical protein
MTARATHRKYNFSGSTFGPWSDRKIQVYQRVGERSTHPDEAFTSGHRPFVDQSPKYAELVTQLTEVRGVKGLLNEHIGFTAP